MQNIIYNESCLQTMERMSDNGIKVDLVITSPPYDDMRKYKGKSDFNFEETAEHLYYIIADGGVVVWVVGDQFKDGSETCTSFKQALYFREVGFNLYDTMIYQKNGTGAVGSNKQYFQSFEYMFVFSKGTPKTINLIKDVRGKYGSKKSTNIGRRDKNDKNTRGGKPIVLKEYCRRPNIWLYSVGWQLSAKDKVAFEHPAIFPEKLARDHIISWSNEGDTIYDPFMGSGTTAKVARDMNRMFIGSEINEDYCNIIQKRLCTPDLFSCPEYHNYIYK